MFVRSSVCLLVCLIAGTCEASLLSRRVGIRDAAAATYTAANRVEEVTRQVQQQVQGAAANTGRITEVFRRILDGYCQQGFVEVEFRRRDLPLFSIRLYLPQSVREESVREEDPE